MRSGADRPEPVKMSRCVVAALQFVSLWSTACGQHASMPSRTAFMRHGEGVPETRESRRVLLRSGSARNPLRRWSAVRLDVCQRQRPSARRRDHKDLILHGGGQEGRLCQNGWRAIRAAQERSQRILQSTWAANDRFIGPGNTQLSPAQADVVALVHELAPQFGIEPLCSRDCGRRVGPDPSAVSPKNAMGVMRRSSRRPPGFNVHPAPRDARQNIAGGLAYLRWLLAYFKG